MSLFACITRFVPVLVMAVMVLGAMVTDCEGLSLKFNPTGDLAVNKKACPAPSTPPDVFPRAPISRLPPTAATEMPKLPKLPQPGVLNPTGLGLLKVCSNVPLLLNQNACPAPTTPPDVFPKAPISRLLPTAATEKPKEPMNTALGLLKVCSSVPLLLNRNACPAPTSPPDVFCGAPISRLPPTAATEWLK